MATLRPDQVPPGSAVILAAHAEEHRGVVIRIISWWGLAALGVGVTAATYILTDGAAFVVWAGPVIIGVWRAIKAHAEKRHLDRDLRQRLAMR